MTSDELESLRKDAQSEIDDASTDYLYVSDNPRLITEPVGIGMEMSTDPLQMAARIEATKFAAVCLARVHRANGGGGSPVVWFEMSDRGIEATVEIWRSARDVFPWCRKHGVAP